MRFAVGLFDHLFGEKVSLEVPTSDGQTRRRTVTRSWLEQMEQEKKMGSSQRSVQFWSVSMANKSSIVSDLHGWRTPSVSGDELQAPGKSGPQ